MKYVLTSSGPDGCHGPSVQEEAGSAGEDEDEEESPATTAKRGGFDMLVEEGSDTEDVEPSRPQVNGGSKKPEEADVPDEVQLTSPPG